MLLMACRPHPHSSIQPGLWVLAVPGTRACVCSGRPEGAVPALHTQLALFWGQRKGTGGGQLSREPEPEPGGWSRQGAQAPGCLTGTAPKAL